MLRRLSAVLRGEASPEPSPEPDAGANEPDTVLLTISADDVDLIVAESPLKQLVREEEQQPEPEPAVDPQQDAAAGSIARMWRMRGVQRQIQRAKAADTIAAAFLKRLASRAAPTAQGLCPVCMCEGELQTQLCDPACGGACAECLGTAFTMLVGESYPGKVPAALCPCCPGEGRVVPAARWLPLVEQEQRNTWRQRCQQLLSNQCAGCHTRKTMLYETAADSTPQAVRALRFEWEAALDALPAAEAVAALRAALRDYQRGLVSQRDVVPLVEEAFGVPADDPGAEGVPVRLLALSVADLERRAQLLASWFYRHPKIVTLCCQRTQCYKCRVKVWHEGNTCEQMTATTFRFSRVCPCTQCGLALVKGDGCSSVTCPCGASISWRSHLVNHVVSTVRAVHGGDDEAVAREAAEHHVAGEAEVGPDKWEEATIVIQHGELGPPTRRCLWALRHGEDPAACAADCVRVEAGEFEGDAQGANEWRDANPAHMWEARHEDPAAEAALQELASGSLPAEAQAWAAAHPDALAATTVVAERAAEFEAEHAERAVDACLELEDAGALTPAARAFRHLHGAEVTAARLAAAEAELAAAEAAMAEAEAAVRLQASASVSSSEEEAAGAEVDPAAKCKHWSTIAECATCRLIGPRPRDEEEMRAALNAALEAGARLRPLIMAVELARGKVERASAASSS